MRYRSLFPPMPSVLAEGQHGTARIEHFTVDETAARFSALRGSRDFVDPGRYARLYVNNTLMMSDTPYERRTNAEIVRVATGRVLVAGYGLGMILTALAKKPDVREIVVVEKHPDVVALVHPQICRYVGARAARKITVVEGDIYDAKAAVVGKFDALWFDIWAEMSTDQLAEMTRLGRMYRGTRASVASFVGFWDREWLRYRRTQERRAGW